MSQDRAEIGRLQELPARTERSQLDGMVQAIFRIGDNLVRELQ